MAITALLINNDVKKQRKFRAKIFFLKNETNKTTLLVKRTNET